MTTRSIITAIAIFFGPARTGLAHESDERLADARDAYLSGEYEKSASIYEQVLSDGKPSVADADTIAAVCGWAEVATQTGKHSDAIARLKSIELQGTKSPLWHAHLAGLYALTGEYDAAARHNREALRLDRGSFRARWQLAQVQEMLGDTDAAIETYRAFNDRMTGGSLPESAEDLTYLGVGFLRYSALVRHPELVRRTRHVLSEVFQEAFEFVDARYWPARLAAAELLLQKHNLPEARSDFELVLQQNSKVPDAHVGLGRIALEDWKFEEAEEHVNAALAICPGHEAALVLLGDTRMTERRYADAADAALSALKTNRNSLPALALLAAAQLRQGDKQGRDATRDRIMKINPRPAVLYYALGRWLAAGRQYEDAEAMLKKAVEFAPTWADAMTELGQLYMEMGEETQARRTLEAAFALDSFNHHSHNVLLLLKRIDSFARLETPNFIIKYDSQRDGVFAPYVAEVMEQVHGDVCAHFGVTPAKKTAIEIFPDHMGFSVRITGRPFIATVGACTGPVIAMQAPRGTPPFGRFNWAITLRHEYTHTVTLAATQNRIPHWMTEGMAVYEEPTPRTWRTKQLLSRVTRRDELFTLETIDWGFMRPRRRDDRELAYAQSEWMVEYIIDRFGKTAVPALLTAFREGLTQSEALQRVLRIAPEKFSSDFRAFAKGEVAEWAIPDRVTEDPVKIEKQLEAKPDDPALWAALAEAQLGEGEIDEAEKSAEKAIKLAPSSARALEAICTIRMARMLSEKSEEKRLEHAERTGPMLSKLLKIEPSNHRAVLFWGYVCQAREDWADAIEAYRKYQAKYPDDPDTYRRLAGIFLLTGKQDQALELLEKLYVLVEDEPAVARQVGEMYVARDQWPRAAEWFGRAIETDPFDAEIHALRGRAFMQMQNLAGARKEFSAVSQLKPDEPDGWQGLAEVSAAEGDTEKAGEYKKKADALRAG